MTQTEMTPRLSPPALMVVRRSVPLVIVGFLLVVASLMLIQFLSPGEAEPSSTTGGAAAEGDAKVAQNLVNLTSVQDSRASISTISAQLMDLQPSLSVSGRLDYDQDRHVEVKAACSGILTEVRYRPGDGVQAGDVLATLTSPEIGLARSKVKSRHEAVKVSEMEYRWHQDTADGVELLVSLIKAGESPIDIERKMQEESLGAYREKLMSAYNRKLLAETIASNSRQVARQGAIPARVQQQRESEKQASSAAVEACVEQSLFDANVALRTAEAKLAKAKRELDIALQELNALLGPAAAPATVQTLYKQSDDELSRFDLLSPIDGTIEERLLTASERLAAGQPLYVIADTSRLWAVADIRQRDWQALNIEEGQTVEVSTPALPGRRIEGKVVIVGRQVDPTSGAAELIAELSSADALLRPGMLIRMQVPVGETQRALAVPERAIVVHEERSFVFVKVGALSYERRDVEVGMQAEGWVEIRSGLVAGEAVVVEDVFLLKSELLLAGEE